MTSRIYYTEPACAEFDAVVVDVTTDPAGRPVAVLDRTAFYPTSGGQPFDTGTLGSVRVLDVVDDDDPRSGPVAVGHGEVGGDVVPVRAVHRDRLGPHRITHGSDVTPAGSAPVGQGTLGRNCGARRMCVACSQA